MKKRKLLKQLVNMQHLVRAARALLRKPGGAREARLWVTQEGTQYVVRCPELDLAAQGGTLAEALLHFGAVIHGKAQNDLSAGKDPLYFWRRRHPDLQDFLNVVYRGAAEECEGREFRDGLMANGHHMAQAIARNVKAELISCGYFPRDDVT